MPSADSPPPSSPKPSPLAERAAVGLLCAAVVVGPLLLGSTGPWARFGLEAAMAFAATLWAVSGHRDLRTLLLPLAVAALFLFQLLPLPDGLVMGIAPVSAGRWKVAHEDAVAGWPMISVDPATTAAAIRRLLLGLATVAAVTSLARTPSHRRWFYTALATSAALIWAAAFAFPVDPDNRAVMGFFSLRGAIEFWKSPERGPLQTSGCGYLDWVVVGDQRYQADAPISGDGFGTYIYSNHYANALCLTLPALWAMWMMLATRKGLPAIVRYGVLLAAMTLAGWTTGTLAHSRAGTASLGFAALVYLALVARSRWLRCPTAGVAVAVAVGLVAFVATFQGPMSGLLAFLPTALHAKLMAVLVDARLVAAQVAGRMFLASPLLGTGLGTYGNLYPALMQGANTMFFAHNEYAQLLAESGLLGAGLLVAATWLLSSRFVRFCLERSAAKRHIDAGAWAALAGAAAHAVFDWGMHAPANAVLASIVAGLALSSVVLPARTPATGRVTAIGRLATVTFVAACLAVVPLLARDAFTGAALDALRQATTAARLAAMNPDVPPAAPRLRDAIDVGTKAARLDPANWQLAALLGHANLHLADLAGDPRRREAATLAAKESFRRAGRVSAAARGMPEPVPQARK